MTALGDERAQGVIEFAFIALILVFVFLGLADFSRFLYYDNAIRNAARTGAEAAMEHCTSPSNCGQNFTPVTDDVIGQATVCESQPFLTLKPSVSSSQCAIPCNTGACTGSPYPSSATDFCSQDICIQGSASPRTANTDVTVYVGYHFQPVSFLMSQFFSEQSCFTGDVPAVNHHNRCVHATGRVG